MSRTLWLVVAATVLAPVPAAAQGASCNGREATIIGTPGDDVLRGTPGRDVVQAAGGADVVAGRGGADVICDGEGDDRVRGGRGDDSIFDGEGDDASSGGRGEDKIVNGDGDDVLSGGRGADALNGVRGYTGYDGGGTDELIGGRGRDRLFSNAEQNRDVYRGGPGSDRLDLRALAEAATVDLAADSVSGAGRGSVHGVEDVYGTGFSDVLLGDDAENSLVGGEAVGGFFGPIFPADSVPDGLDGRGGDDHLDGGTGDDTIAGGEGRDVVRDGVGRDSIDGGPGDDLVSTTFRCVSPPSEERCAPPQEAYYGDEIDGGEGSDALQGGLGDDTLLGAGGNDFLAGSDGADELRGDGGIDRLRGGDERDDLDGGDGNDWADFADAPAGVSVDLGAATVAGGSDDALVSIESASGSAFDDMLLGSNENNHLDGRDGDDVLRGLAGDDDVDGGDGEDETYGDDGDDRLTGGFGRRYLGHNQADGRPDLQDGGEGVDGCWASAFDELVGCEQIVIE